MALGQRGPVGCPPNGSLPSRDAHSGPNSLSQERGDGHQLVPWARVFLFITHSWPTSGALSSTSCLVSTLCFMAWGRIISLKNRSAMRTMAFAISQPVVTRCPVLSCPPRQLSVQVYLRSPSSPGVVGPKGGKHEDYLYHSYLQKWLDVGNYREEHVMDRKVLCTEALKRGVNETQALSKQCWGGLYHLTGGNMAHYSAPHLLLSQCTENMVMFEPHTGEQSKETWPLIARSGRPGSSGGPRPHPSVWELGEGRSMSGHTVGPSGLVNSRI